MADTNWTQVFSEAEDRELNERMDADRDLIELANYVLKDTDGNQIPHSVSVTVNDPAVFCANVEAALGSSSEQVIVESNDRKIETGEVEDFIRYCFAMANDRLSKLGMFAIEPVIDQMMCRRGSAAARVLFQIVEGTDLKGKSVQYIDANITPWDTRFMRKGVLPDGTKWKGLETKRDANSIEAEYPRDKYSYPKIGRQGATVRDIWTDKENIIYIGNEQIESQAHDYGRPPIADQIVPIGSMLSDYDSRKRRGESLLFLIRDLIPELNRLISIVQSLNVKALDAALTYVSPPNTEPPEYEEITKPGSVTQVTERGGIEQVPYGDIKRSATLLHAMVESRIQKGSLSSTDLGTMNFPLSAVALIEIGEGRDKIFLPRLGARGLLKQQIAELFIEQILNLGESTVELGSKGHMRPFKIADIDGQYSITYQYFVKSPQIDIARVSMAGAYGNLVSERYKRNEVLKLENPDAEERQIRWEMAERLSPAIMMHRTIKSLLKRADEGDEDARFEAEILSAEMGVSLKQMMTGGGGQLPTVGREQKPQQPLLPLLGSGGGNPQGMSSQAKASQLQEQPTAQEAGVE
jgi:hypothetical protein